MLGHHTLWHRVDKPARLALRHWTPQLFATCMGTGILAVLLNQLPYQFNGLRGIAVAIAILDLCLFLLIGIVFLLRCIVFSRSTLLFFKQDMDATAYLSCSSVALSTLVDLSALILGSNYANWVLPCVVFFWIDVGITFLAVILPVWVMIHHEHVALRNVAPSLLYPCIAMTTNAAAGAVVCRNTSISSRLSLPIVVISYMTLGLGLFLAILIQAVLMTRFVEFDAPSPSKVPTLFVTVGPLSTAGYAFQVLGAVAGPAKHVFQLAALGPVQATGENFFAIGMLFALLMAGFATFWICIGIAEVIHSFGHSTFTLNTWSSIYPIGTYALSFLQLAKDFDSPALRACSTGLTIVVLLQWLYAVARTLPLIISGHLLLEDVPVEEWTTKEVVGHSSRLERGQV